jgi:hypothetical protein
VNPGIVTRVILTDCSILPKAVFRRLVRVWSSLSYGTLLWGFSMESEDEKLDQDMAIAFPESLWFPKDLSVSQIVVRRNQYISMSLDQFEPEDTAGF